MNPNGRNGNEGFAYYEYGLDANLDLEVPLHFALNDLMLRDTLFLETTEGSPFTGLNSGVFSLIAENGFPVSANLCIKFYDQGQLVLDSICMDGPVQAADINGQGRVDSPKTSKASVAFSANQLDVLSETQFVVYEAKFNTLNNQEMKLYSDYQLNISLVANVNYNLGQ